MDGFKNIVMTAPIYDYMRRQAAPPSEAQERLIKRTDDLGGSAEMQIPHEQGVLLTLLVKLVSARTVVEIGTFTGYSTLCLAQGLSESGRVITCDLSEEWAEIAREAWADAGVDEVIDLRIGRAADTLEALPRDLEVDLVFIDADKVGYVGYWEQLVPRVRSGGLLLADNVLYDGEAADDQATGNGAAIRAFNEHVLADDRVESVLLPIADGLTIARKH
jgi:caffeoyl-CoA O-methyltransferase